VRIVLNADDFGSSEDTIAATIACFDDGLLTSASIMLGAPETDRALDFAVAHPEHSFGVHLQFVGDGTEKPLCDVRSIPALVDEEGRFLPTNVVRVRALLRRVPVTQIEREIVAQVEFVQQRGIPVSHVDSHRHLHKFPPFRKALSNVLPRLGVERVRNVQDTFLRRPIEHPAYWAGPIWRRALARSFRTTDHFYMPTTAHDPRWHELSDSLPAGTTLEVGLHPGHEDAWRQRELKSLRPFVEAVTDAGHTLVGWNAI
jgi:hypothetical protein